MDDPRSIDDPRITAFGHLFEAHARLTRALDAELVAAFGLPLLQYGVLLHLGRAGGQRPMGELVAATAFTSGGVTRLVDRMEQAGLVERRPCATDRRVHLVGLTDAGRTLLERATAVHLEGLQRHMVGVLAPDEVARLDAILAKLVASERSTS